MLQTKGVEKIKTHILCSVTFFSSKIVPFMRKGGKILYSGVGHRRQYGACALHAGYLRLQTRTLRLCNTHCFSTAVVIARTRLNVTLYVHWPSLLAATSVTVIWERTISRVQNSSVCLLTIRMSPRLFLRKFQS